MLEALLRLRLFATSDTLCRADGRSCCGGRRCQDGPWHAAQRHGVQAAQRAREQPRKVERASTRSWWSPRWALLRLRLLWRRVTRCSERMEGRAAVACGVRTAHGMPPSAMGSKQRSSLGHSRGRSSEPRLAVGGHRGGRGCGCDSLATSDTLWREHARSCCDDGRCEDGPWRAS